MTVISLNYRSESEQRAIREQLARILDSAAFQQSRRRQRFLEYIVNETLAGRGERLKGYNVALAVFDRPNTFDSALDPIVRIEAARLREKLREYYEADGQADPIRIDLPKGRYTPRIEFRQPPTSTPPSTIEIELLVDRSVPTDALPSSEPALKGGGQWQMTVALLTLVLFLSAAAAWLTRERWMPAPEAARDEPAVATPNVPAIAVLPFTNLSGDQKQDYFSDGLTEDILTELSRARDLRVIARNTTFQYKGKAVDIGELGRELDARYVLEGSVQRANDRLRVNAQLIDAKTGTHIWADRYDRDMADVFLVQDEIVNQIVGKIAGSYGAIERNEAKSAARKNPNEIQAYDLVLRARDAMQWDWTSETFSAARAMLNQAVALDPTNAQARRELAWLAVIGWIFRLDETPVSPDEITAQATKAVELDPADARARMVAASAYFFTKQLDLFAREADQALALAPYDAEIIAVIACMISSAGDHERGVDLGGKGERAERRCRDRLVSFDRLYRSLFEGGLRPRARSGAAEPRPGNVLLLSRDHPDLRSARHEAGSARSLAQAAQAVPRRHGPNLRRLVALVEHSRRRGRETYGRRLQVRRCRRQDHPDQLMAITAACRCHRPGNIA